MWWKLLKIRTHDRFMNAMFLYLESCPLQHMSSWPWLLRPTLGPQVIPKILGVNNEKFEHFLTRCLIPKFYFLIIYLGAKEFMYIVIKVIKWGSRLQPLIRFHSFFLRYHFFSSIASFFKLNPKSQTSMDDHTFLGCLQNWELPC